MITSELELDTQERIKTQFPSAQVVHFRKEQIREETIINHDSQ